MSEDASTQDLGRVAVIIPALNEAENLARLLPILTRFRLGQVIVCDNGSTDRTREGRSKISGTVRGVVLAAYWITRTCAALWLTKRRRVSRQVKILPE